MVKSRPCGKHSPPFLRGISREDFKSNTSLYIFFFFLPLPEQDEFLLQPPFEKEDRVTQDQAEKADGRDKAEKTPRKMLSRGENMQLNLFENIHSYPRAH